jgi:hypothetical protein
VLVSVGVSLGGTVTVIVGEGVKVSVGLGDWLIVGLSVGVWVVGVGDNVAANLCRKSLSSVAAAS